MKRTNRIARRTVVSAVAVTAVLAFAGVGLSQVVAGPGSDDQTTAASTTDESTTAESSTTGTTNGNGGQGNGQKVQICHFTHSKKHPAHTIWVSTNAEPAFLNANRRDHLGPCTAEEMKPVTTTSTTSTTTSSQSPKNKRKNKNNRGHGNGGRGH